MRHPGRKAKYSLLSRNASFAAMAAASAFALAGPAEGAGTPAGTNISNVATATYDLPGGGQDEIVSNTVIMKVDELLDVSVAWGDPSDVATSPGQTNQVLKFSVSNGGNGPEAFTLGTVANGGGDDFDPNVTAIVLDSNNNGAYDAGADTVYVAGSNDPELQPDQSVTVFVLATIPGGAADGNRGRIDLTAVAVTGSGAPGTTFAGKGEGGVDAIAGATGADGEDDGYYKVAKASVAFVKSASVAGPFGGTSTAPGAIVTYSLSATVSGSGSLANLRVSDPIPAGTTYVPGTITLDGGALSDAADADAGRFTGTAISVALGNAPAGANHIVTFKVKID